MGHARAILTLPEAVQIQAAQTIVGRELSVRETENLVRQMQAPATSKSSKPSDPDIIRLQDQLSRQLKLRVAIQCNAKGRGKLTIHYKNLTELDHLLSTIQDENLL